MISKHVLLNIRVFVCTSPADQINQCQSIFQAKNPTDKPIDGISTYNVVPYEAGQYFNKIQCFCFEEQRLNSQEEVDMPVFFYIDPDYLEDPFLEDIDTVYLSYTFFESKPGMKLPTYNSR